MKHLIHSASPACRVRAAIRWGCWLALLGTLSPSGVQAQRINVPTLTQPHALHSGKFSHSGSQGIVAFTRVIQETNLSHLRLHFDAYSLGKESYVRVTSLLDGGTQRLTGAMLAEWGNTTAMFNGSAVRLELYLAPDDGDIFVSVDQLVGLCACAGRAPLAAASSLPETLCGPDDRVASADNRSGRVGGNCTAWLVSNGAVLTAGHCAPLAANAVFEVNIPPSTVNGIIVFANPATDQFPVVANSATFVDGGTGNDWTVFRLGPNSVGQRAHALHGFFRMTTDIPVSFSTIRVTGCGLDTTPPGPGGGANAQSQTLQTSAGPMYVIPTIGSSVQYQVDTEPANSGSPVIRESDLFTIGIHTHGGCSLVSPNSGTAFSNSGLAAALQSFPGANTVYVDTLLYPNFPSPIEDGTVFHPFDSICQAVTAASSGAVLSIVAGSYNQSLAITKPLTLTAPVGQVTIGR